MALEQEEVKDEIIESTGEIQEEQVLPESEGGLDNSLDDGQSVTDSTDDTDDADAASEQPTLAYDGVEVSVEIPDDLKETFKAQGLDAQALVNELYGGEEFGLSEETKAGLYKLYGKTVVEGYLDGLKARNDAVIRSSREQEAAVKEANDKVWNETLEAVGGEEGWSNLEQFALETLSDEELDEFNSVMSSGSRYAQKLALKDLQSRLEGKEGTGDLQLVQGDGAGKASKGFLTRAEYLELHTSGEYRKDPKKYDALRSAGLAKGY